MPRAKPKDAPSTSRWQLDEAVRGETALDSSGRVEFDFPVGEVTVDVGSPEEAVLARVLTQTAHAVPVDEAALAVALAQPVNRVESDVVETELPAEQTTDVETSSEEG